MNIKLRYFCSIPSQHLTKNLAPLFGYATWNELFHSNDSLNATNKEYCEDELDDMQNFSDEDDGNGDGVNDIRLFYNCK